MTKKRVLITGSNRSIGKAIADKFSTEDFDVIALSSKELNLSDLKAVKEFIEITKKVDILINNAGINIIEDFEKVQEEDFDELLNINLKAPYFLCKLISDGGSIINISSIYSEISREKRSLYSMSKSGLNGMARALAIELAPRGILVNNVSPGFTVTDLTKVSLSEREYNEIGKKVPLGRMAEPYEIAEFVFWLATKNTFITGQNIIIDGGHSII